MKKSTNHCFSFASLLQVRAAFQRVIQAKYQTLGRSATPAIAILSLIALGMVGCDRNAGSVQTMLEKATVLNDRERFDEALALLDRVVSADRGNADAYYLRGVAHENLEQFDRALEAYDHCLKIQPDHTDAFNNRGVIHGRVGNLDLAVADLKRAVDLNPDDALAWSNLGLAYHELGDLDSAVNFYSEAVKRNKSPQILYQRGNSHLAAKRFGDAINDYSQAIKNDSAFSRAYLNRAIAYFRSGDALSATADLDRAEEFDNDMSITPLVQNLRESLDRRTVRIRAVEVVRVWLEHSGWEVNSDESCPVDFVATRLPSPIDPSDAEVEPQDELIPDDFYAVVLVKEPDADVVSNFELMKSAMSVTERQEQSAADPPHDRLCLFVVDVAELGSKLLDPATGQPFWLFHANYDWRPTPNDFETHQVRVKLPQDDRLASGP